MIARSKWVLTLAILPATVAVGRTVSACARTVRQDMTAGGMHVVDRGCVVLGEDRKWVQGQPWTDDQERST